MRNLIIEVFMLIPFSLITFYCTYSRFKGIWILDSSLQGFVMLCRKSQMKYNVPMRCLDPELEETNDVYEQIEISSFCRPQATKLNIRVIQVRF